MNATILYDEFDLAARANAMLMRAAHRAHATVSWSIKPWRTDLLVRRLTADIALHEAASAHLIVIAVRNQAELPPALLIWLETWAEHRQVHDAALAVFDGRNGDLRFGAPSPALVHFAERHDLSFILGDTNPNEDKSAAFLDDWPERESPGAPTRVDILEQVPGGSKGGWGTNN